MSGSNTHEVGRPAGLDAAALAQAVEASGDVGDPVDGLLQRDHAELADAVGQQRGAVDRAAHHVEVGAGVGSADDGARVAPHLGAELPVRLGVLQARRSETGAELVGHDDVEQHVERVEVAAAVVDDLADRAALVRLVLGRERLDDLEALPVREAAEQPGLVGVGAGVEAAPHVGVRERSHALGHREREHLPPAGEAVEHEAGQERQP